MLAVKTIIDSVPRTSERDVALESLLRTAIEAIPRQPEAAQPGRGSPSRGGLRLWVRLRTSDRIEQDWPEG